MLQASGKELIRTGGSTIRWARRFEALSSGQLRARCRIIFLKTSFFGHNKGGLNRPLHRRNKAWSRKPTAENPFSRRYRRAPVHLRANQTLALFNKTASTGRSALIAFGSQPTVRVIACHQPVISTRRSGSNIFRWICFTVWTFSSIELPALRERALPTCYYLADHFLESATGIKMAWMRLQAIRGGASKAL
jgi:hypothetical protein